MEYVDVYCKRPLCVGKSAPATHALLVGNQVLPICEECAKDALTQGDFALVPNTKIIVMQIAEDDGDNEHGGPFGMTWAEADAR